MKTHTDALKAFTRKLALVLMFRGALQWATVWFFIWGAAILALRFARVLDKNWLVWGLAGAVPLAIIAAIREYNRRIAASPVRAAYDKSNQCGGVIMAAENADTSAWQSELPQASVPVLQWRSGRSIGLFGLSTAFVAIALLLPDRMTTLAGSKSLEIGQLVSELRAEVETLKEEKILEPEKADDVEKQLERLHEKSSALDPNKTWEALDHIREANSNLAKQAAEEIVEKMQSLTQAETLAAALEMAVDAGLSPETMTRFAQELAGMVKSAKLEEGLLNGSIPPELLSNLEALSKEDLEKLMGAFQFNKSNLGKAITNLAKLKLIDAKSLSQCKNAGECKNPSALAAFLCQNTNASACNAAISFCAGNGGVTRGPGHAPMTWKDESSEQGAKFKEEALPASNQFENSQFVGVSRTAPELSGDDVTAGSGALANASAGGSAANSQVILPRHKQAVQQFFKRQE